MFDKIYDASFIKEPTPEKPLTIALLTKGYMVNFSQNLLEEMSLTEQTQVFIGSKANKMYLVKTVEKTGISLVKKYAKSLGFNSPEVWKILGGKKEERVFLPVKDTGLLHEGFPVYEILKP